MKRVQITRTLNKPSIRFVRPAFFSFPLLSLSSKIKNLLFSPKENLLTFLHAQSWRRNERNEKREKEEEEEEAKEAPLFLSFANRPLGIITSREPRRACRSPPPNTPPERKRTGFVIAVCCARSECPWPEYRGWRAGRQIFFAIFARGSCHARIR